MIAPELVTEYTTTDVLVDLYQNRGAVKAAREKAFIFLTYRFRKDVLRKCEILCKHYGHGVSTAETIASQTFESYARKGHFDASKGKGKTYDESFLLYLLGIAEHELIDYYRDIERKKRNPYDGTEQIYSELPAVDFSKLDPVYQIEANVISGMSHAHRTIYLTYKVHQRSGFKMPRKLLEQLRKELGGIKQDTVNCYLKEARDEIKCAIEIFQLTTKIQNNGK